MSLNILAMQATLLLKYLGLVIFFECIKLIKSDSKNIHNVTKDVYLR